MRQSEIRRIVDKMVAPLSRSVRMMMSRCTVALSDASREIQTVQVKGLKGEVLGAPQYPQHYGFRSVPLPGASGFLGALFGSRSQSIILASTDARFNPKDLKPGEVCIFDNRGQFICLRQDCIEIISPLHVTVTTPLLTVDAPQTVFTGDVQVDGSLHVDQTIDADEEVSVGNISLTEHRHSNVDNGPGTSGGPVV